jgi:hypothetical protein
MRTRRRSGPPFSFLQVEPPRRLDRATTVTELSDIARAAIIGPYWPKRPKAARGMPTVL